MTEQMKVCTKCKSQKVLSLFGKDPRYNLGVGSWCKACKYKLHRETTCARVWARKYRGLIFSEAQEKELLLKQNGKCALCDKVFPAKKWAFAVDHDHNTGRVRGILCTNCNRGIGFLKDSPTLLQKAINYLQYVAPC